MDDEDYCGSMKNCRNLEEMKIIIVNLSEVRPTLLEGL